METARPKSRTASLPAEGLGGARPTGGSQPPRLARWAPLVLLALVAVVALPIVRQTLDLGDEGFMAHCAERVLHGQLPHRDFYSLQGPLSAMLMAGWSAVAGLSFLKLRVAGVLIHAAMVLLTYAIARRFAGAPWAFGAAAVAVLVGLPHMHFAPLAIWQGLMLSLLSVWLAVRSLRAVHGVLAFASGAVAALSMLVRHDQGFYMALSIAALAIALRFVPASKLAPGPRFRLGNWLLGTTAVALPALLFFWTQGALPAMWDQLVLFPLTRYSATSAIPMPSLGQEGPAGSLLAFVVFRITPLAVSATLGLVVWRARRKGYGEGEALGLFLAAWSMLMYAQVLVRSDLPHLVITLHPTLVLLAWLPGYAMRALGLEGERHAKGRSLIAAGSAACFAALAIVAWHMLLPPLERDLQPLRAERAGLLERASEADVIDATVRTIQERTGPTEAVLVLPYQPAYYVLSQRRNPTQWGYHWPGDRTNAELAQMVSQLQQDPPALAVVFHRDSTATYLGPVVQWLEAHYAPVDPAADPVIYTPRER
ncbi:MAG: hypothetical protein QY325_15255 [Flavobacteriales bacterium]|nr:MAG: hypothetical protein QY325_15255 [Flavobacteriales bacterium]